MGKPRFFSGLNYFKTLLLKLQHNLEIQFLGRKQGFYLVALGNEENSVCLIKFAVSLCFCIAKYG